MVNLIMDIQDRNQNKNENDTEVREDERFVKQIYRYKLSDNFVKDLFNFSKLHQKDKRKDYKEAWELWVKANDTIVQEECNRLRNMGYNGDIVDKMFKSSRYYFRKKSTCKTEPRKRRKYVSCDHEVLVAMDDHISKNYNSDDFTPADGYDLFCENNKGVLSDEIKKMIDNDITDKEFIRNKIKKTYKNRYFLFIKNNS